MTQFQSIKYSNNFDTDDDDKKIDKQNILEKDEIPGLIFLPDVITFENITPIINKILLYNVNKSKKISQIQIFCNSNGGQLHPTFSLIDVIERSKIPIYTIASGIIASAGLLISMSGHKGCRIGLPRSIYLSHSFSTMAFGTYHDLKAADRHHQILIKHMIDHYTTYTKFKTAKDVTNKLLDKTDYWFDAKEALDMGFIDEIQQPQANTIKKSNNRSESLCL